MTEVFKRGLICFAIGVILILFSCLCITEEIEELWKAVVDSSRYILSGLVVYICAYLIVRRSELNEEKEKI